MYYIVLLIIFNTNIKQKKNINYLLFLIIYYININIPKKKKIPYLYIN